MTPAFIGSGDATRAEWNGKAIRGELRWWFRALAGGEMKGDAARVRVAERELFGGADEDGEGRSSVLRVMVHAARANLADTQENPPRPRLSETELAKLWSEQTDKVRKRLRLNTGPTNPIAYLGYGPVEHDKNAGGVVYKRGWIAPDRPLTFILQWNRDVSDSTKTLFDRALWCWINLGGIGARSRRGFGSLVMTNAEGVVAEQSAFERGVADNLRAACKASPTPAEWSHFSANAHVYRSSSHYGTWCEAMKVAGAWMIAFRRRYGKADDERPGVRNHDYEWLKSAPPPAGVPDRAGFGMPLPFGRMKIAAWGSEREGRRASPLLIHIARFGTNNYAIIFTHIPARLVPDGEKITFMGKSSTPTTTQQRIVQDFLDDLKGKNLVEVVL